MMLLALGRWRWFDLLFVALAALIVYPDHLLDRIGDRLGREFHWIWAILLSALSIALFLFLTDYLRPLDARIDLSRTCIPLIVIGGMRVVYWFVDTTVSV